MAASNSNSGKSNIRARRSIARDIDVVHIEGLVRLLVAALQGRCAFYVRQYQTTGDLKVRLYTNDEALDYYISYNGETKEEIDEIFDDAAEHITQATAVKLIAAWVAQRAAEDRLGANGQLSLFDVPDRAQRPAEKARG